MRSLIYLVGAAALILIVLGLFLKALKWLIILGVIALGVAFVLGFVKKDGRR